MAKLLLKNIKKSTNKTVKETYEEYIDYCIAIGQRPKTIESKEKFCKYVLNKVVNLDGNISQITKEKIQSYIIFMRKNNYKGNTYQTFVIKLRAFLTYCFMRNYLNEFNVKIPNIDLEKKEIYTEEELNKLLKKPDLSKCLVGEYKSWVTCNFLLGTGCRAETLLHVHVEDIDFVKDSILFRHMKTKRQITVPLSNTLKVVLREYISVLGLSNNDLLFPKLNMQKMRYDTLHQNIKNFFDNRKVVFRGINVFRNTFATMFILNKGDIYRLKVILGHSNIKTTERYINLLPLDFNEDICDYNPLDILSKKNIRTTFNRGGRR
ncbi:site-specific integrase [Hathewaya histolytica]|uniref:XerC/D integrase-recombinase n=1 Tax=Hathewaya histolytica TaxID=1498 RepID=A0A4V6KEC2_HATHI|nr:site-specific integrase [Hathewaya histolytica]VTQ86787.1 XerC/D integrase-recombinase [Hathewaya histolytica]